MSKKSRKKEQQKSKPDMKRVGFVFEEGKAPPRQGAIIQFDGEDVGTVTSGTSYYNPN